MKQTGTDKSKNKTGSKTLSQDQFNVRRCVGPFNITSMATSLIA